MMNHEPVSHHLSYRERGSELGNEWDIRVEESGGNGTCLPIHVLHASQAFQGTLLPSLSIR